MLIEKDELLLNNKNVAEIFSSYFQSITYPLDLFEWPLGSTDQIYDSVDRILESFRFHPHPVRVPRWPSDFPPGIKTKFNDCSGKIQKILNSLGPVDFPPGS